MKRLSRMALLLVLLGTARAQGAPAPGMATPPAMVTPPGMVTPPAMATPPGMAPAPGRAPAPKAPAPATPMTLKPGWVPHAGAVVDLGDQKRVFVGDPFRVTVTVIARAGVAVNLPTSVDLGDFSLLKAAPADREVLDGKKVKHVFRLTVAAYSVGELTLPPIPVTYVPPREAFQGADDPSRAVPPQVITTQKVQQRVASVLANEPQPQLKKNAPPMTILVEDRRMRILFIVLIALLVGAALGFLIFWLLRNRRRHGPPPPPPRPAHETALAKLRLIREAGYLERGEFKPFYFGVSEAIRDYLGNRYGFDSLEMTTTELADQMRAVEMIGLSYEDLIRFLMDCDLVKFAKYIPPLEEAERILAQAEHIVHSTKFVPVPDEDDEDDDEGDGPDGPDGATRAPAPMKPAAPEEDPDARWTGAASHPPSPDAEGGAAREAGHGGGAPRPDHPARGGEPVETPLKKEEPRG